MLTKHCLTIHHRLKIFEAVLRVPKSHCAKVQAYCSACDHLIRKISSGMFQESSSFETYGQFSDIDVFNGRSFLRFSLPYNAWITSPVSYICVDLTRNDIPKKIRAVARPEF